MHDVHTLERAVGLPAVAIVSTTFAAQAIFQSEALGLSDPEKHIVLCEHVRPLGVPNARTPFSAARPHPPPGTRSHR